MITMFTGSPGAGKTAAMVAALAEIKDRPLYVAGLDGLKLPHEPLDPKRWHEVVPDGAVVVIDEVQSVWRPRGPSQAVTPDVAALEVHRHRGIDFFLTTQRPSLVDSNVRGLIGRHVHIRDTGWLGRWWYEWPECSDSLAWKTCAMKRKYKLPARAFALYKSASLHTTPIRGKSPLIAWGVFVGLALLVLVALLFWRSRTAAKESTAPAPPQAPAAAPAGRPGAHPATPTAAGIIEAFTPRLPARPETAPAYDHLRVVQSMPDTVGGYCVGEVCKCQTWQGTPAPISDAECRAWIASPPFNPYRARPVADAPAPSQAPAQAPADPLPAPGAKL